MKERIVIEEQKFIEYFKHTDNDYYEHRVEQVPETWEELKELCKGLKGNKKDLGGAMWFEFPIPKDSTLWLGKFLCVDIKGQVGIAEKSFGDDVSITIFAQNRTPAQMWQIIKSLIGEE